MARQPQGCSLRSRWRADRRVTPRCRGGIGRPLGPAAALTLGSIALCAPASAETWVPLQFRSPLPIEYLVDVDGLSINGNRRSVPAKWLLEPDSYELGAWQFDCRARTWKSGGIYTIVRTGAALRTISLPEVWRTAKQGSSSDQLMSLVCLAPINGSRDWLAQQLQAARL